VPTRAAIITGASRGIGLELARALGEEGYALTLVSRKPERLASTAAQLRAEGLEVEHVAADVAEEQDIRAAVARHRERYGRLDVLVNSAGVGVGAGAGEHQTRFIDLQLAVNLRAIVIMYRECLGMLRAAAAEHRGALVVNLASLAGISAPAWLSVYGATKAAVIAYTRSMNRELAGEGIKSVALCPGFVDTDMSDFIKGSIPPEEMLRPRDLAEALRFLLRLSPPCVVPQIIFERPGEAI
jgi:NAD(P)-dependent dehydrogenase (short-subunit alcohol dehydrogenase family)